MVLVGANDRGTRSWLHRWRIERRWSGLGLRTRTYYDHCVSSPMKRLQMRVDSALSTMLGDVGRGRAMPRYEQNSLRCFSVSSSSDPYSGEFSSIHGGSAMDGLSQRDGLGRMARRAEISYRRLQEGSTLQSLISGGLLRRSRRHGLSIGSVTRGLQAFDYHHVDVGGPGANVVQRDVLRSLQPFTEPLDAVKLEDGETFGRPIPSMTSISPPRATNLPPLASTVRRHLL